MALTLWSQESRPVKLEGLKLDIDAIIQSGYRKPTFVDGEEYTKRHDSY